VSGNQLAAHVGFAVTILEQLAAIKYDHDFLNTRFGNGESVLRKQESKQLRQCLPRHAYLTCESPHTGTSGNDQQSVLGW
jgi:hypothetical protein